MTSSLLKGIAEEKIVFAGSNSLLNLSLLLKAGIVRIVNKRGDTLGLVLNKAALDEIEEEIKSNSPEFLASLEESRSSGRVPGKEVKKKAGIK